MRNLTALCAGLVVLIIASAAVGQDRIPLMDLRVGIRGGPNVNILSDVAEEDPTPVYPGFVGVGWFIGGTLAFDYLDMVGIEIGVIYSVESASGTVEFDRDLGTDNKKEESDFTLETTALHIPLLIRGQIPAGVARPFLHLGVDFAVNRSAEGLTVERRGDAPPALDPFPQVEYGVIPVDSTTYFLVGLGLDIDVGTVTVPVEFRGLINPKFGNSVLDRTEIATTNPVFRYRDEWHYQVMVMFGVNYLIF